MYKTDLPLDLKEAAVIERRKNAEAARKSRIFDSQKRTIGVDLAALEQQVQERKARENDEKLRHDAYAGLMIRNDQTAQLLEANAERTRLAINKDVQNYRDLEQKFEGRREFDLNDPAYLKKMQPLGQNVHGVSSLQSFIGEDISQKDRKLLQQEQIREWSLALQSEKQNSENDKQLQDRMHELKRIELDNKACELERIEKMEKDFQVANLKEFNQRLAAEQNLQRQAQQNEEQAANSLEIRNQILGDMLTENPDVARSAFGPHRVIPDRWKGMSNDEIQSIRQEQENQRLENIRKAEQAKDKANQWDLQKNSQAKAGILLERQNARQTREMRKQLDAENAALAKQQQATRRFYDQELYTNVPSEDYYKQFNTCTR